MKKNPERKRELFLRKGDMFGRRMVSEQVCGSSSYSSSIRFLCVILLVLGVLQSGERQLETALFPRAYNSYRPVTRYHRVRSSHSIGMYLRACSPGISHGATKLLRTTGDERAPVMYV